MADPLVLLGDAHRQAQNDTAAALIALILALWREEVRPGVPNDTMANRWLTQVAPYVLLYRERSAQLARGFYEQSRLIAAPDAPAYEAAEPDPLDLDVVLTSLTVTGIIGMTEKIVRGMAPELAFEQAGNAAGGAAMRHAMNGGRSFMHNTAQRDQTALGWYRTTAEGCCWFCAMLASRGVVYKADSFDASDARWTGPGSVKVHDNCRCGIQGVFSASQEIDEFNLRMKELWKNTGQKHIGDPDKARSTFRAAYEASLRAAA